MNAVKIKCRDLMVGDWITNRNGFPMQITNVGDDYAYATFEGLEGDPWEFDDKDCKPSPIEITYALLEDNGWRVVIDEFCDVIYDGGCVNDANRKHIEWRKGDLSIWFDYGKDYDGVYSDILVPCKYVHQLQCVLRLAGMTDMANNFKVK